MSKVMLINTVEGQECRIAVLDNGRLEELYTERASSASQVGNIYKGKITNIEPSIQAAFIDFGGAKNGFLHISDVHPKFFPKAKRSVEKVGRRTAHRTRPPIQDCLKRGQEIVVQMTKQGIGTKGPTLTSYLSIPGRLIVMMPGMTHTGISRKIEDDDDRKKIRKILNEIEVPKDMGMIVRTAGIDRTKRDLQRDVSYLTRLWKSVLHTIDTSKAPAPIYQESDLVIRTIRDVYDAEITNIICDSKEVGFRVKDFLDLAVPRAKCKIEYYCGPRGLFDEYNVEDEIQKMHSHRVDLRNGGSLIIDQAEALVAIDVNSGSFRAHSDAESNALNLNLAAAEEIGRQLRLRDMGGVIVIDFVDMREEKNRRTLERKVRDVLKNDRAKSKVLRLSSFGMIEMTRQRLRPSLKQSIYSRCPHCEGTGLVMSQESVALSVMRALPIACANDDVAHIHIYVSPQIAHHLVNAQRHAIAQMELATDKTVLIHSDADRPANDWEITAQNHRGSKITWDARLKKGKKAKGESKLINIGQLSREKVLAESDQSSESDSVIKPITAPLSPEELLDEDQQDANEAVETAEAQADTAAVTETESGDETNKKRKRRRRGRRGGKKHKKTTEEQHTESAEKVTTETKQEAEATSQEEKLEEAAPAKKKRRRRRRKKSTEVTPEITEASTREQAPQEAPRKEEAAEEQDAKESSDEASSEDQQEKPKKRRRRGRRGRGRKKSAEQPETVERPIEEAMEEKSQEKPKPARKKQLPKETQPEEKPQAVKPEKEEKRPATRKKVAKKKAVKKATRKPATTVKKTTAKPKPKAQKVIRPKAPRVFEVARELGIRSKDILDKCAAQGLELKNHLAAVSPQIEKTIRKWFS